MIMFDKFRWAGLGAILSWALVGNAAAGTKLNVASLSADGQEVRQLSCDLEEGGFTATFVVVGTLAKQKAALDRCAPKGAAFATSFTWRGGATSNVKVTGTTTAQQNSCVSRVLAQIAPPTEGSCSLILLVGDPKGAQAAAAALAGKPAPAKGALGESAAAQPSTTKEPDLGRLREAKLQNLEAMELAKAGQLEKAVLLGQQAMKIREEELGPRHPQVAGSLMNLGKMYQGLTQYDQAEAAFKRALQIVESAQGPKHPDTATALMMLANLYKKRGALDKAEPLIKRATMIRETAGSAE
jgi:hypothetical protein